MAELPSGTVTFLFTDVEGSTRLLKDDRQTVDQAPWVPLVNPRAVDVLSKRLGNYQYSAPQGPLIDQRWLR